MVESNRKYELTDDIDSTYSDDGYEFDGDYYIDNGIDGDLQKISAMGRS